MIIWHILMINFHYRGAECRAQVNAEGEIELQVVIDERYINNDGDVDGDINCYYLQNRETEQNLLAAGFIKNVDNFIRDEFVYVPATTYYTNDILPGVYAIDGNKNKERLTKA